MKIQDLLTSDVKCCGPDTNLAAAAKMMWDSDCGALPILNVEGHVMGMITATNVLATHSVWSLWDRAVAVPSVRESG